MKEIEFYSFGIFLTIEYDINFNLVELGASFSKNNIKIVSRIIRDIYKFIKDNPKEKYIIGIQCLNGMHRSVDISDELCKYFNKYFFTSVVHL